MQVPRRRFIKFVTFGVATSFIAGKLWQRDVMAYCTPLPGQKDAVFKVRISDFPALQQDWGSVRLGLNPVRPDNFPDGAFYPFIINRDDAGNFYVLDGECRHQSCVVPTYDTSEGAMHCPCHGSLYGIDGTVIQGPAQDSLHAYQFEYDGNDTLAIHIPCWGLEVKGVVMPGGPNSRIRLDFEAGENITYQVSFRQRHADPWTTASFATTPTGPANQTSLTAFAGSVSVYLDRTTTTGFYAVSMKLSEV
jgi:Rieske Fe-S protein